MVMGSRARATLADYFDRVGFDGLVRFRVGVGAVGVGLKGRGSVRVAWRYHA